LKDGVKQTIFSVFDAFFARGKMQPKPEKKMCGEDAVSQIKSLIESNPHYTTRDIAEIIDVSQKTVVNYLYTLGYISRYDIWIPHNLSDKNLIDYISICDLLLKRNENCLFLK